MSSSIIVREKLREMLVKWLASPEFHHLVCIAKKVEVNKYINTSAESNSTCYIRQVG